MVIWSSRRSTDVPPVRPPPPPNMSDSPPPFPECSSTKMIRNSEAIRCTTMTAAFSVSQHDTGRPRLRHTRRGSGFDAHALHDGLVLEREVAGRHLPLVVRRELRVVLLALRELGPGASGMEPAPAGRVDRRGHVALQDDPLLLLRQVRV